MAQGQFPGVSRRIAIHAMLPQLMVITEKYRSVRKLCKYKNAIYSQLHFDPLHSFVFKKLRTCGQPVQVSSDLPVFARYLRSGRSKSRVANQAERAETPTISG